MRVSNTIEKRRPLLLLSGIVIALSFTLVAFEWRMPYYGPPTLEGELNLDNSEDEEAPVIRLEKKKVKQKVNLNAKPKAESKPIELPIEPDKLVDEIKVDDGDIPDYGDDSEEDVVDGDYEIDTESIRKPWELDSQPTYARGTKALLIDLTNLANPPRYCYELDEGATVTVRFVVDVNGKVVDPVVVNSSSRCFEPAAIEAILKLDDFRPGIRSGHAVPVELHQTFRFKLE